MELKYVFCAKFADIGPDGLFAAIGGGLDSVAVPQLPAIIQALSVVGCVTVPLEEVHGGHRMRIEMFGPTGDRHPVEIEFPVTVQVNTDEPRRAPRWTFAIGLQNVVFGMEGRHEFRLSVDGNPLGIVPLHMKRQAADEGGQA
jgi:hypothetical protein